MYLDLTPIMSGSILNPIFYSFKNHTLKFLKRRKIMQITLVSKVPRLYEQHKNIFKYQPYFCLTLTLSHSGLADQPSSSSDST